MVATPRSRRTPDRLPAFTLYGEAPSGPGALLLHIESIDSRSRLYDWEIDAHTHQGLHQVLWVAQGRVEAMLDESRVDAAAPLLLDTASNNLFDASPSAVGLRTGGFVVFYTADRGVGTPERLLLRGELLLAPLSAITGG